MELDLVQHPLTKWGHRNVLCVTETPAAYASKRAAAASAKSVRSSPAPQGYAGIGRADAVQQACHEPGERKGRNEPAAIPMAAASYLGAERARRSPGAQRERQPRHGFGYELVGHLGEAMLSRSVKNRPCRNGIHRAGVIGGSGGDCVCVARWSMRQAMAYPGFRCRPLACVFCRRDTWHSGFPQAC